jgi:hypothetical protein
MTTAYIYNLTTMDVHVILTGSQAKIEAAANQIGDPEDFGMTYTPAFGCNDGLNDCDVEEYDVDDPAFDPAMVEL